MKTTSTAANAAKGTCTKSFGMPITATALAAITAKVDALDLGCIKFKLVDPEEGEGWTRERADRVEREYRNFLVLCAVQPDEPTVPFGDVDTFWHQHILDTHKYAADCQAAFGRFLHHFPYLGMRGEEDKQKLDESGEATQVAYQTLFGTRMGGAVCTCDKCCSAFSEIADKENTLRMHERPSY